MSSIKERILASRGHRTEPVPTPEWPGVELHVRQLSGRELLGWQAFVKGHEETPEPARSLDILIAFVVLCAVHPDGTEAFTVADQDWLMTVSLEVLRRVAGAAVKLNGMAMSEGA